MPPFGPSSVNIADAYYTVAAANGFLPNAIVIPNLAGNPDALPATPSAFDDEFAGPALDAKWTWFNQGTATVGSFAGSSGLLSVLGGGSDNVRAIEQTCPATPWTITAKLATACDINLSAIILGLFLRDSVSGRLEVYGPVNSGAGNGLAQYKYTNATTFSANTAVRPIPRAGYFRITDTGVNLVYDYSFTGNGVHWCNYLTVSRTNFLTNGPNRFGLAINTNLASIVALSVDFFRKT